MADSVQEKSVLGSFHKALLLIYLVSVLISVPAIYLLTKNELYSQASQDLNLLVDAVRSMRGIVREQTRPHFLPKGEFYPLVLSSTVMAKQFAFHFKKLQPTYLIRMVSDNPLNRKNLPEGLEAEVLETLRHADNDEGIQLMGRLYGREYLISATASRVKNSCLICHGDPNVAPKEIIDQYGSSSGFGWIPGSVVGASLVGVPVADLNTAVIKRSAIFIGIVTLLFAGVMLILRRVVVRNIIRPMLEVTEAAKKVSMGQSNQPFVSERNDEIGSLIRAFELMRRSINIAAKQLAKNNSDKKG